MSLVLLLFFLSASSYNSEGYIMARTEQGDKLILYLGVIDILQSYKLKKKFEHGLKSIITDGVGLMSMGVCN